MPRKIIVIVDNTGISSGLIKTVSIKKIVNNNELSKALYRPGGDQIEPRIENIVEKVGGLLVVMDDKIKT